MKKKRQSSVLRQQRTKKKNKPWLRWLFFSVLVSLLLALGWQGYHTIASLRPKITNLLAFNHKYLKPGFQINIVYEQDLPPTFSEARLKSRLVEATKHQSAYGPGLTRRLSSLVWRFHSQIEQSSVTILRSDQLLVKISFREAAFKLSSTQSLYLSKNAQVFRGNSDDISDSLPILNLDDYLRTQLRLSTDNGNHLVLNAPLSKAFQAVLELREDLEKNDLKALAYHLEGFRGIEVELENSHERIVFGWAPFPKKIERLQSILSSYSEKTSKAARIELDFSDKAFIQEKL